MTGGEPCSHAILQLNVKGSETRQNAEGRERKGPRCSESFKLTAWFSMTSVIHWMWPQWTLRLHRSGGGGRISVQYQNAVTGPIEMELSRKKKTLNFRADIIINDFLPPTFLLLIVLNYISPATVFFYPSSTGKLATVPYLFRKHYGKFQPSLMYPEGVGSHVDSDKEEAWQ